MSLADTRERLRAELATLQAQWAAAREIWRDAVGARFEREFWVPGEQAALEYLRALQELEDVFQKSDSYTGFSNR